MDKKNSDGLRADTLITDDCDCVFDTSSDSCVNVCDLTSFEDGQGHSETSSDAPATCQDMANGFESSSDASATCQDPSYGGCAEGSLASPAFAASNESVGQKDSEGNGNRVRLIKLIASWVVFGILIGACALLAYGNFKYSKPYEIYGNSMLPSYKHEEMIYLGNRKIDYNSVVIFDASAISDEKTWIKRIVAFGGDKIWIDEDGYVNVETVNDKWTITHVEGKPVDKANERGVLEGYYEENPYPVPKNCVFFMGDNRNVSKDCRDRTVGAQSIDKIIGVVEGRIPAWYAFVLSAKESLFDTMGCSSSSAIIPRFLDKHSFILQGQFRS